MRVACDKYIERVLKGGEVEKSIAFCKERKLFYRSAIARNELTQVDKKEAVIQIRKLSYIIEELSRSLNDGEASI